MKIAVLANDDQWNKIYPGPGKVDFLRMHSFDDNAADVEAHLILQSNTGYNFEKISGPVLINSVVVTLKEMNAPGNVARFNGWKTFLSRDTWEVAGIHTEPLQRLISALGKQTISVHDEPGFISARVIAMIINEAYFALQDKVSSKEEIDMAMKLGTNYPYGPFEWATLIGLNNILALLQQLMRQDKRYIPAPLLKKEASL